MWVYIYKYHSSMVEKLWKHICMYICCVGIYIYMHFKPYLQLCLNASCSYAMLHTFLKRITSSKCQKCGLLWYIYKKYTTLFVCFIFFCRYLLLLYAYARVCYVSCNWDLSSCLYNKSKKTKHLFVLYLIYLTATIFSCMSVPYSNKGSNVSHFTKAEKAENWKTCSFRKANHLVIQ